MRQYGLDPKQSLGQNWLVDESHLARIAAAADLSPADTVLEIGPGLGGLTRYLAAQAGRVIAVELDDRLIPILQDRFADQPHVEIVHADILGYRRCGETGSRDREAGARRSETPNPQSLNFPLPISSILNFQFSISTRSLPTFPTTSPARCCAICWRRRHPPTVAVLLVQKEVAQRLCAEPGDMSILAVSVQFYAQPKIVQRIPAGAFHPRPKVDSAVVRLDIHPQPMVPDVDPVWFFTVVRAGFGQKRKQLLNSLSTGMGHPKDAIEAALHTAGIDPKRRAQTLSLDEWGGLNIWVQGFRVGCSEIHERTIESTRPKAIVTLQHSCASTPTV